jgi:hypothetical protein
MCAVCARARTSSVGVARRATRPYNRLITRRVPAEEQGKGKERGGGAGGKRRKQKERTEVDTRVRIQLRAIKAGK